MDMFSMRHIGLALIVCFIIAACAREPEHKPMGADMTKQDEHQIDPALTPEQTELVKKLSTADVEKIDKALLSNASHEWRKVARVVGATMIASENRYENIPDIYYSQRVIHLVQKGLLESQGNLNRMRFSEIRLPTK